MQAPDELEKAHVEAQASGSTTALLSAGHNRSSTSVTKASGGKGGLSDTRTEALQQETAHSNGSRDGEVSAENSAAQPLGGAGTHASDVDVLHPREVVDSERRHISEPQHDDGFPSAAGAGQEGGIAGPSAPMSQSELALVLPLPDKSASCEPVNPEGCADRKTSPRFKPYIAFTRAPDPSSASQLSESQSRSTDDGVGLMPDTGRDAPTAQAAVSRQASDDDGGEDLPMPAPPCQSSSPSKGTSDMAAASFTGSMAAESERLALAVAEDKERQLRSSGQANRAEPLDVLAEILKDAVREDWNALGRPDANGCMIGASVAIKLDEVGAVAGGTNALWSLHGKPKVGALGRGKLGVLACLGWLVVFRH